MCATCGCSGEAVVRVVDGQHQHQHDHDHNHSQGGHSQGGHNHQDGAGHEHGAGVSAAPGHLHTGTDAGADGGRTVILEQKVLAKNDRLAALNREWLAERGVLAINLMSSPGAGKTTLLERTARELGGRLAVIEGDQETTLDASRIKAAGAAVVQINTGAGCHLDAAMVAGGLRVIDPPSGSILVIENVGNLVCPALFDLGEAAKVVISSVTEGADKPAKYPNMFRQADLVLLNKTDLLPYVDFDVRAHSADLRRVSPASLMLQVSAATGEGLSAWYDWLWRRTPPPADPES